MDGGAGQQAIREPNGWINTHPVTREEMLTLLDCLKQWNGIKYPPHVVRILRNQIKLPILADHIDGIKDPANSPYPFMQVMNDILHIHQANVGILEEPYLDIEWWVHNRQLSFLKHRMGCRLHFFRTTHSPVDVWQMVNGKDENSDIAHDYLGFLTLMTDPDHDNCSLGRSCIHPLESNRVGYSCIKTLSRQHANVLMKTFEIKTVPYIQHVPSVVGNCATASIWMASNMLTPKFELSLMRYNQIAEYAGETTAPPQNSKQDFLYISDIVDVLGKIDAKSKILQVLRDFDDKKEDLAKKKLKSPPPCATVLPVNRNSALDQLYLHIESGLPVILGTHEKIESNDGHAMVVVGHLQPDEILKSPSLIKQAQVGVSYPDLQESRKDKMGIPINLLQNHYLISQFYRDYLVHDEARGPFRHFRFKPFTNSNINYHCACLIDPDKDEEKTLDLQTMIIPMPPIGDAEPSEILNNAICMFNDTELHRGEQGGSGDGPRMKWGEVLQGGALDVLWRIVLTHEIDFKKSLNERHYPEDLIERYKKIHFPRFIYVCEFSICNEGEMPDMVRAGRHRIVSGEFIYDTTTTKNLTTLARRFRGSLISPALDDWYRSTAPFEQIDQVTCYCGAPVKLKVDPHGHASATPHA